MMCLLRAACPSPTTHSKTNGWRGGRTPLTARLTARAAAVLALASVLCTVARVGAETVVTPGQTALQELRTFATTGRVLHIGAHPDDENTQLIAYLSRGRGYDTAYLSVTRGDGGQNLLGPQFDEKLGVARTQELLAARRIDGGRQFFTRAIDFGFTKNPEETLSIWNHQEALSDVVRVIRRFRPDVVISRFPIPPGSGGHGQHTASAILAVEAFKLAGDPKAFPEQLREGLQPWQPKRIVWNAGRFFRNSPLDSNPTIKVDIGGTDPVTGETFGAIAGRSRSMHKTQGFGDFGGRGGAGPNVEPFVLLAGDPAEKDFMDGVDTTWNRVAGGAEIGQLAQQAVADFDPAHPEKSVPALLKIRKLLASVPVDTIVRDKRDELDRVLERCLGLVVSARANTPDVVPGETASFVARIAVAADVPVRWLTLAMGAEQVNVDQPVKPGAAAVQDATYPVAKDAPLTQPYWLREPPATGMYRVADPRLIGDPENPPDLPVRFTLSVDSQELTVADQLTFGRDDKPAQRVAIIPPVSFSFGTAVEVFHPGQSRHIIVEATAARPDLEGRLELETPSGWRVSPARSLKLARAGEKAALDFEVSAPAQPDVGTILLRGSTDHRVWSTTSFRIDYPHIPMQLLQPAARLKVVGVDVATRGHALGYIPGAGDDVPQALEQLGYEVTLLPEGTITAQKIAGFDAIVIGVRAFNTRSDLGTAMPVLSQFVEQGGTVVAQYNWSRNLKTDAIAPYSLKLSDSRVTNEDAPVTFLAPDHPALNTPNKITSADFEGWVQERGIYFPSQWDEHFVPLLAMSDPGEAPLKGALLVARHGKGYYVYTGLVFFRELPAGVPGAYRLFANLVSLGK